jgi:hypothetical protein
MKDVGYASIKGMLGSFPIVGPYISEIYGISVNSPIQKRLTEHLCKITNQLETLEKAQLLTLDYLKSNQEFLDILIHSGEIAMKNSQEEKLELLRNAVINTALGIDVSRDEKSMLMNIINEITPLHYKLLKMFYQPKDYVIPIIKIVYERQDMRRNVIIPESFNEILKLDKSLFKKLVLDLQTWQLIATMDYSYMGFPTDKPEGMIENTESEILRRNNYFGKKFFEFVHEYPSS